MLVMLAMSKSCGASDAGDARDAGNTACVMLMTPVQMSCRNAPCHAKPIWHTHKPSSTVNLNWAVDMLTVTQRVLVAPVALTRIRLVVDTDTYLQSTEFKPRCRQAKVMHIMLVMLLMLVMLVMLVGR